MDRWIRRLSCFCAIVALVIMVSGCGGSSTVNLADDVDGKWVNGSGGQNLVIHFKGAEKYVELGSTKLPVTVKTIDENHLLINGPSPDQDPKEWKLVRVWNSNGSEFGIALIHDGIRDDFPRRSKS